MTDAGQAASLRAEVRSQIESLSSPEREEASARMIERFWELLISGRKAPLVVSVYESMKDEPNLKELTRRLNQAGHRVVVPQLMSDQSMTMGGLTADQIDILVVPGRVFGERGERIGRGKGHYDRYLSSCKRGRPLRVALAFELQVRPTLPQNSWDEPMDWIVTEKREIKAVDA